MKAPPKWPREPDNWYSEEHWCSERLFAVEAMEGRTLDPCAGNGHIVASGRKAALAMEGWDLRQRAAPNVRGGIDWFAEDSSFGPGTFPVDNIVSNPPYGVGNGIRIEDAFLILALQRARCKVALFLPAAWPHSDARGRWLEHLPWYRTYMLSPRPSCPPGYVVQRGEPTGNGQKDFCWFVFLKGYRGAPTTHYLRREP